MSLRLAIVACVFVSGCAAVPPSAKVPPPLGPGEVRSARVALDAIVTGKSTKADVRAALGEGTAVDFDSGYSAWVYREQPKEEAQPPRTELVILFSPAGVVTKARVR